jgi:integrase
MVRPKDRTPEDIENHISPADCGICGKENPVCTSGLLTGGLRTGDTQNLRGLAGICEGCKPWARVALNTKQLRSPATPERDAIYARIKKLRRLFEDNSEAATEGTQMLFSLLAKRWYEDKQSPNMNSRSNQFYGVRALALFFDDLPAAEMTRALALDFREHLSRKDGKRGQLAQDTVSDVLRILNCIYEYADRRRLVEPNPLAGEQFTYAARPPKTNRLVTVQEERALLAACDAATAVAVICLADTGMYVEERKALQWRDVDLWKGVLDVGGRTVQMTPRLRDALWGLWIRSDRQPESPVWLKVINIGSACTAVGIKGLTLTDFRRAAAWRMTQAGRGVEQIAETVGVTINSALRLRQVNPAVAAREANSQRFKNFIGEQFGDVARGFWNPKRRAEFLNLYEDTLALVQRRDASLPEDVRAQAGDRGVKPSDAARDYAAHLFFVTSGEYLQKVLIQARAERRRG